MARFAAELCLQQMTPQQAQRIAGEDAVWPKLSKADVFDLVQIEIRAGSTGRPNKSKEREQWGQMLPQIQKSVEQIMQLRTAGQDDMAETVMKLLEETLRRFDERIDIESFLPARKEGQEAQQIPPELQQQMQQGQQMIQQLQAENQQLKQGMESKQQDAELRRESAQQQAAATVEAARIRAESQAVADERVAMINAEVERERIASQERIAMAKGAAEAVTALHSIPAEPIAEAVTD